MGDTTCSGSVRIKSKRKRREKRTFRCPECNARNCIDCQVIHKHIKDRKLRRLECADYQFLNNNKFLSRWKKFKLKGLSPDKALKKSKMMKLYSVKQRSEEWKEVVSCMQTHKMVTRIDRVQNSRLYRAYYKHCRALLLKRRMSVNQVKV